MFALSKPKLRKLRREKKLEKLLRKEEKDSKNYKQENKLTITYRRLLTTFSCNVIEEITKVRVLIAETNYRKNSQYYVVTVCDDLSETYIIWDNSNNCERKETNEVEDSQSFVLQLPPSITTDEQAIAWAKDNMRGHYKKLEDEAKDLRIKEKQIGNNIAYFYKTIKEYKKLKRKNLISAYRSSYPSANYCWDPELLCTTPDGVCISPTIRSHYGRRAIIRKSYNSDDNVKNYLGLDDETLFGYGSMINESIKEIFSREGNNEGEIWDLETCEELNISDCGTMTCIETRSLADRKVTSELIPYANEEIRKILQNRNYERRCSFFTDEIIFDKYKRAVNSEQYSAEWNRWQSTWKLIAITISDYGLPLAVVETIIKKYLQPLRVTENDLRKIRVERWLRNLSMS